MLDQLNFLIIIKGTLQGVSNVLHGVVIALFTTLCGTCQFGGF